MDYLNYIRPEHSEFKYLQIDFEESSNLVQLIIETSLRGTKQSHIMA